MRASWTNDAVADGGRVDGWMDGEGRQGSLSAARHSANERNDLRRSARLPSRHLSCTDEAAYMIQRLTPITII